MVIFTWWPLCVTRSLSWERSKLGLAQKSFLHICAIIPQSEKTLSPMCKSEIWGFQNAFAFPFFCFCYRLVKNANVLSLYVSWWKVVGWWFHKRGIKNCTWLEIHISASQKCIGLQLSERLWTDERDYAGSSSWPKSGEFFPQFHPSPFPQFGAAFKDH